MAALVVVSTVRAKRHQIRGHPRSMAQATHSHVEHRGLGMAFDPLPPIRLRDAILTRCSAAGLSDSAPNEPDCDPVTTGTVGVSGDSDTKF